MDEQEFYEEWVESAFAIAQFLMCAGFVRTELAVFNARDLFGQTSGTNLFSESDLDRQNLDRAIEWHRNSVCLAGKRRAAKALAEAYALMLTSLLEILEKYVSRWVRKGDHWVYISANVLKLLEDACYRYKQPLPLGSFEREIRHRAQNLVRLFPEILRDPETYVRHWEDTYDHYFLMVAVEGLALMRLLVDTSDIDSIVDGLKQAPPKMWYPGFSYGTLEAAAQADNRYALYDCILKEFKHTGSWRREMGEILRLQELLEKTLGRRLRSNELKQALQEALEKNLYTASDLPRIWMLLDLYLQIPAPGPSTLNPAPPLLSGGGLIKRDNDK